jgi:cytochrome oxidase assembly protein ShyY1
MHLSYAAQWFLFASALLAGAVLVVRRGRAEAAAAAARR